MEGEHSLGPVHSHPGSYDPRSPLQIPRSSSLSQETQTLHGNTRRPLSPGADGADGSADKWPDVDPGLTWEDYGPRVQVPKGYTLNEGTDYLLFNICLPSGEMKPTKYIKLEYREDPLIYGMIDRDPHQYVESFQATPFPSASPLCTYTSSQLEIFESNHNLRPEVDSAVFHLFDKGAMAEVECYRVNKKILKHEYEEMRQIQHDIWKQELTLGGCARHMAGAWIYQHIELVNRSRLQVLIDEYKAHRCGRRT